MENLEYENAYSEVNEKYGNKGYILNAIKKHNYEQLRDISSYFYEASGIYQRMCEYLAYLYRYDWCVTPYSIKDSAANEKKILKSFSEVLEFLDNSNVKKLLGDIAF